MLSPRPGKEGPTCPAGSLGLDLGSDRPEAFQIRVPAPTPPRQPCLTWTFSQVWETPRDTRPEFPSTEFAAL